MRWCESSTFLVGGKRPGCANCSPRRSAWWGRTCRSAPAGYFRLLAGFERGSVREGMEKGRGAGIALSDVRRVSPAREAG